MPAAQPAGRRRYADLSWCMLMASGPYGKWALFLLDRGLALLYRVAGLQMKEKRTVYEAEVSIPLLVGVVVLVLTGGRMGTDALVT